MGQEAVPAVLAAWVLATAALCAWRGVRDGTLAGLVAGWGLLPVASYAAAEFLRPVGTGGSALPLAVPSPHAWNRASAAGLSALVGLLVWGWPAVRRLRPSWRDLPVAAWCLAPVASGLANAVAPAEWLGQARALALGWGVPYLAGRAFLGDNEGLRRLGLALTWAGLAYAPLALLELAAGPFVYTDLYGTHPYQLEGAARRFGFRPMGVMEHGNQLGLWVALAAVSAGWLWASGRLRAVGPWRGRYVAAGLAALCVACQSHGATALAAAALGPAALWGRGRSSASGTRRATAGVLAGVAVVAALALAVAVAVSGAGRGSALRNAVRDAFGGAGKSSFTWRLARSEDFLPRASERPWLGHGRTDWLNGSRPGAASPSSAPVNPVNLGLWLHAFGLYGALGLAASSAVFLAPAAEALARVPARRWWDPGRSGVTLAAALLLVSFGDSLLNGTVILPVVAAAGGLATWGGRGRGEGQG